MWGWVRALPAGNRRQNEDRPRVQLSQVLDQSGVCVRAGHHCAKPLMRQLGVAATTRASLYLYNDRSDVDALVDALERSIAAALDNVKRLREGLPLLNRVA